MRPMESSERKAGAAAVESEDELVEIALEMFPSQAVVDAELPSLQVGEESWLGKSEQGDKWSLWIHGSTIWAAMLPTTWGS